MTIKLETRSFINLKGLLITFDKEVTCVGLLEDKKKVPIPLEDVSSLVKAAMAGADKFSPFEQDRQPAPEPVFAPPEAQDYGKPTEHEESDTSLSSSFGGQGVNFIDDDDF